MYEKPENPNSLYFTFISLNAALGSFCFGGIYSGYTLAELNPIEDSDELGETSIYTYMVYVCFGIGGILGAASGGFMADKLGRRMAFYIADIFMILGSALVKNNQTSICYGVESMKYAFIAARFISGIASGIYTFIVPLYSKIYLVNELVPLEKTGSFGSLHQIAVTLGNLLGVTATILARNSTKTEATMLAIPGIVACFHIMSLKLLFNYESPSYLWINNRRSEALIVLEKLYCLNNSSFYEVFTIVAIKPDGREYY
jgi:MFS family permease